MAYDDSYEGDLARGMAPPSRLARAGRAVMGGLNRVRQGIASQGIDLNHAFLIGKGEYGAASDRAALMAEQQRYEREIAEQQAFQRRRQDAIEALQTEGIDPTESPEMNARAAYEFYKRGDFEAADMVTKLLHQGAASKPMKVTERRPDGSQQDVLVDPNTREPIYQGGFGKPDTGPAPDPNLPFDRGTKLRGEFDSRIGQRTRVGVSAINRMRSGATQETAAGDIALIYGYMKFQDPESSVREGEYATAQNSGGVMDSVRVLYNKLVDGQRLTPEQRANFLKAAEDQFDSAYRQPYLAMENEYRGLATRSNVNPNDVLFDSLGSERTPRGKPQPVLGERPAPGVSLPNTFHPDSPQERDRDVRSGAPGLDPQEGHFLPPKEALVKGRIYETKNGRLRWDGDSFEEVD